MFAFLPFLDEEHIHLLPALDRIVPVLWHPRHSSALTPPRCYRSIEQSETDSFDVDQVTSWLDEGTQKVVVPVSHAKEIIGIVPAERVILTLDVANVGAVPDTLRSELSGILLKTPTLDLELIASAAKFFAGSAVYVWPTSDSTPIKSIRELTAVGATLVIPSSQLTLGETTTAQVNIADAFLAPVVSDRSDGLFPTIVSSQTGHSLGLVYSSVESVTESILTGKGVYQSRKHGLWRKGEKSGATQKVVSIRADCDSDSLEFRVIQDGVGFCHLDRQSCFGEIHGLPMLEKILLSRLGSSPEGSYTRRLFDDPELLKSKIMEEAEELCEAETSADVSFEAADLLYFALTKCVAAGVGIADIEQALDKKRSKISRRPGNAKAKWIQPTNSIPVNPTQPAPAPVTTDNAPIRMRKFDVKMLSSAERAQLLKRPVLKSDEMINKVRPIVNDVRQHGDVALLEFTARFDKVKLESNVIFPPFPPDSMEVEPAVRSAIDVAYANIRKFHAAQVQGDTLVVETMPGVVCSRFARPIARVGLYVPGGTAILPSTALMLGIPAQVAGCKEIVLATPPRTDGTISPEVMYVARLVGASAVLKGGGAQAIAALAYGTATVPKVDKIFGPGNQWVTAAKMLVQNDTDALVSIDMPAGPSEVLVIADHTANPSFVVADLLSQAEHGVDSQVVLVTVNLTPEHMASIEQELDNQARCLPRVDIVRQSVSKSIIVETASVEEAIVFSNDYAPEHLILHLENAKSKVDAIDNAGSVFVGPYTPESCGDYASGTNHTLPTNGYARQFSGVNTLSFQKHITAQEITREGLRELGPIVATLANCEGLDAHANAVCVRLRAQNH